MNSVSFRAVDDFLEKRLLNARPLIRSFSHAFVNPGEPLFQPRAHFHPPEKMGMRDEFAELHRMRMRLGGFGNHRDSRLALTRRRRCSSRSVRKIIVQSQMRIHERRAVEIIEKPGVAVELDAAVDQKLDRSAVRAIPIDRLAIFQDALVVLDVDFDGAADGFAHACGFRNDARAGRARQLRPSRGGGDPNPLLAARTATAPEFRGSQVLAENLRHIVCVDSRAVVLDPDQDLIGVLQGARALFFDRNPDLGQNPVVLAGVQRVIDRFFERSQNGLGGRRETDLLEVLGKVLGGATRRDLLTLWGEPLLLPGAFAMDPIEPKLDMPCQEHSLQIRRV